MLQLTTYLLGKLSEAVNIEMNDAPEEGLSQEAVMGLQSRKKWVQK